MITRIMCTGPARINELMATLSFDQHIFPQPDRTYVITPYHEQIIRNLFKEFNINGDKFTILSDNYFDQFYDLARWKNNNWYKQQVFKLCALDHFESEYFLIQDSDIIILKPYSIIISGNLNFKAESFWIDYQNLYSEMVEQIIGYKKVISDSLVNEFLPYTKKDWIDLKDLIETKHRTNFLDAIANIRSFDDTKWFSEYELLGIYKTNQPTGWQHFTNIAQPPIFTWNDFYNINWSEFHSVKFQAAPLKCMSAEEAKKVVKFLKENHVNN